MSPLRRKLPLVVGVAVAAVGLALWSEGASGLPEDLHREWVVRGQPGPWLTLSGLLLLLGSIPLLRSGPRAARLLLPLGTLGALACGLATVFLLATQTKHAELLGRSVWWLDDDMMITLRYARNLALGDGLVWNAGERVEGITNFTWAVVLAPVHLVLDRDTAALGAILLAALAFAASVAVAAVAARRLGAGPAGTTFVAFAVATAAPLVHWTAAGGEAALLALALLVMAALAARFEAKPRTLFAAALCFGLVYTIRPDGIVAALPLLLGTAVRMRRRIGAGASRRPLLVATALALLLPLALTGLRWVYYGDPLPNTYYLKATGWDGRGAAGLAYVKDLLSQHWVLVLCTLASALLGGRLAIVSVAPLLHLAYVLRVGGDELPMQRFLAPVLPLFLVAAFAGLWTWCERLRLKAGAVLATFGLFTLVGYGGALLPISKLRPAAIDERQLCEWGNLVVGELLRENTREEATVAHFWAGAAAYFSERRGVDLLGKCDPRIARQEAHPGLQQAGHNKYDFALSLSEDVDVVVGGNPGGFSAERRESQRRTNPDYRAFVDLFDSPLFAREFAPNLVGAQSWFFQQVPGFSHDLRGVSREWHGVYVRQGSPRARPADAWRPPSPPSAPSSDAP